MEERFQVPTNGQSVLTTDLNGLGTVSGLADDRVFAELLRLGPYDGATVRRGILPYGSALAQGATVAPNGASGSVLVNAFRAFIGSRTAVATDAKANWRDIRSAISVGATTLGQAVALAANASGNPRWDLVYVAIAVDANGASVTRKVKDPTSKVITAVGVVTTLVTTATLLVVTGTPGASPAFPALPSDAGGTYYVPLAYVRVPNGFGAASTVLNKDVNEVAPSLTMSRAMGVASLRPADQSNVAGGTAISGAGTSPANGALAWSGAAGTRAPCYLPPSMTGKEELIIPMDFLSGSSVNWSHQNGAIVDASRDWRNRLFKWHALVGSAAHGVALPFAGGAGSLGAAISPQPGYAATVSVDTWVAGMGHSFAVGCVAATLSASGGAAAATPGSGSNIATNTMANGTSIQLIVNQSTGNLEVTVAGLPGVEVIFWLEASAPFANR